MSLSSIPEPAGAIEIFVSYAHEDETQRKRLAKFLNPLQIDGVIINWKDRDISAGTDRMNELDARIRSAQIILLLISADFMASEHIHRVEVKPAMQRYDAKEVRIIPILLKPIDWQGAPFGQLKPLPDDGRPISSWRPQEEAFNNIQRGVCAVISELKMQPLPLPPLPGEEPKTPWQLLWEVLMQKCSPSLLEVIDRAAERALEIGQEAIDSLVLFEALLQLPGDAVRRAFTRTFTRVETSIEKVAAYIKKTNESGRPAGAPATTDSKEELGLSQGALETLVFCMLLARQSQREKAEERDLLDAFIFCKGKNLMRVLELFQIKPAGLLGGAFQENGELDEKRFSHGAKILLRTALDYAQQTRMVGSSQILATLVELEEKSLARKMLWVLGYDPDRYVKRHLNRVKIFDQHNVPVTLNLKTCSSNVQHILNVAELLARSSGVKVNEDYLFKAYWQCIGIDKREK